MFVHIKHTDMFAENFLNVHNFQKTKKPLHFNHHPGTKAAISTLPDFNNVYEMNIGAYYLSRKKEFLITTLIIYSRTLFQVNFNLINLAKWKNMKKNNKSIFTANELSRSRN